LRKRWISIIAAENPSPIITISFELRKRFSFLI